MILYYIIYMFSVAFGAELQNRPFVMNITPNSLSGGIACDFLSFVREQAWFLSPEQEGPRVPWLLLFLAFCRSTADSAKCFTTFFNPFAAQQRVYLPNCTLIWKLEDRTSRTCKHIPCLKEFGFGRLSGLFGYMSFSKPLPIWHFLILQNVDSLHSICLN